MFAADLEFMRIVASGAIDLAIYAPHFFRGASQAYLFCECRPATRFFLGAEETAGSLVDDRNISASVLSVEQDQDRFLARVGIFFTEIVGGCNCSDDPLEVNAYCVLEVAISRRDGVAKFTPQQL